jgi:light-regulated signal transduction histidine kinase (bacteriophytochrome)
VARNISQVKKTETILKEKNKELQRSNAELETFAFVASHDLKEPLRMVSNFTQLLASRYADRLDENAKEYIGFAVEGVHRMQQLINDLLSYSRIGRTDMKMERVDIQELLNQIVHQLQGRIAGIGAKVQYEKLPQVKAVPHQMDQLFRNLLENALKFRREEKPLIRISAAREKNYWLFSVSDNGIGIEEEYRDKVFVLFQRLHDRSVYEGTGIGLTICKKIVELHKGRIWFESVPGKGTTFYFTLPVAV